MTEAFSSTNNEKELGCTGTTVIFTTEDLNKWLESSMAGQNRALMKS